jgi:hypothetical protein
MTYTSSENETHEANHIAYNAAAIYVVGKIDDALFDEVAKKDFRSVTWSDTQSLIHITGPSDKQTIRFAQLDTSGRYLRFFAKPQHPVYSSLPLLRATPYEPLAFLRQHLAGSIIRIKKPLDKNKTATGLLIGKGSDAYISALLVVEAERLFVMDAQPVERGAKHEFTYIFPVDDAAASATRSTFLRIADASRVLDNCRFNTNTRLTLTPV